MRRGRDPRSRCSSRCLRHRRCRSSSHHWTPRLRKTQRMSRRLRIPARAPARPRTPAPARLRVLARLRVRTLALALARPPFRGGSIRAHRAWALAAEPHAPVARGGTRARALETRSPRSARWEEVPLPEPAWVLVRAQARAPLRRAVAGVLSVARSAAPLSPQPPALASGAAPACPGLET